MVQKNKLLFRAKEFLDSNFDYRIEILWEFWEVFRIFRIFQWFMIISGYFGMFWDFSRFEVDFMTKIEIFWDFWEYFGIFQVLKLILWQKIEILWDFFGILWDFWEFFGIFHDIKLILWKKLRFFEIFRDLSGFFRNFFGIFWDFSGFKDDLILGILWTFWLNSIWWFDLILSGMKLKSSTHSNGRDYLFRRKKGVVWKG